jgi:superkiller protein 3
MKKIKVLTGVAICAALLQFTACKNNVAVSDNSAVEIISDSLPITIDSLRNRAIFRTQNDSLVEALQDIDVVINNEGLTVENGIALSEIYLLMGKADQAQRTLYNVLETHPEDAQLFTAMARVFLIRQNYAMCHNYVAKAYELDPSLTMPVFYDGLANAEEGDTIKAINCFSNVLLVDPEHYDSMIQLGLIYSSQKDPLAAQYLQRALEIFPESTEAWHLLGLFYQETGSYRKALETYDRILQFAPEYVHALYNTGFVHLVYLSNYDSAALYFDKAISIQPEYVDALYNLGYAYELSGEFEEARKYYRRVLEIRPDYVYAIQGIQRVRP